MSHEECPEQMTGKTNPMISAAAVRMQAPAPSGFGGMGEIGHGKFMGVRFEADDQNEAGPVEEELG